MPKRRSRRAVKKLNASMSINNFSDSEKIPNKITRIEQENLRNNIRAALEEFNANLCKAKSTCNQPFFDNLTENTKELPDKWLSTIEYWLLRIYYLYETVNSFSEKETGKNYLIDVNVNWETIFKDIKKIIEKSPNRQETIDIYKQNLSNLRKELIASFTDKKYLLSFLQEINWSNSETPIPITLDINKKITDIIIKFDQDIFDNIKRGMREPFNVVNFTEINQMDNSTSLTNSVNSTGILLVKPEIKTAGLLGISTPQFWTGFSAGSLLVGAFTTVGIGLYCCFFNKHREVTAVRDLEANTDSMLLVNLPKNKRIFKK